MAGPSTSRRHSHLSPSSVQGASSSRRSAGANEFKPKLPLDPFANMDFRKRDPIIVPAERLISAAACEPRRDVILVLGAPSSHDLSPLFHSEQLAFSLLIIASHQPPNIPARVQPTVRILRLAAPLGLEQAGAVRFVNILEWTERVARTWRKNGGIGVHELDESDEGGGLGALAPPPHLLRNGNGAISTKSNPPSPLSSSLRLESIPSAGDADSTSKRSRKSRTSKRRESKLPSADPSQRPFDALINFLPSLSGISEKSLLKQAILVTTISRPFLVAAIPPALARPQRARASVAQRKSFLSRASVHSVYSLPPTPPMSSSDSLNSLPAIAAGANPKAHLVHLLPAPAPSTSRKAAAFSASINRVLSSIESFLLGFSFPAPPALDAGAFTMKSDGLEPARTFLSDSAAFGEPVATGMLTWTVADVILSGCVDTDPPHAKQPAAAPRAWISGAADIVVSAPDAAAPLPLPTAARTSPPSGLRVPHTPEAETRGTNVAKRASYAPRRGAQLPTPPSSDESVFEKRRAAPAAPPAVHARQRSISMSATAAVGGLPPPMHRQGSDPHVRTPKRSKWKFWRWGR